MGSQGELIFEVFAVVGGERQPPIYVGEFESAVGERRCIDRAHLMMRGHDEIEHVLVYNTSRERAAPRYIGVVRREARRIARR